MKLLKTNSSADPTRQAANRKAAHRRVNARLRAAMKDVIARFKEVPRKTIQTNAVEYKDDEDFYNEITALIILAMLIDNGHYLDDNIAAAFRSGSVSQINAMQVQLKKIDPRTTINLQQLLLNPEFQTQLLIQQQVMRDKLVDGTGRLSSQVVEIIKRGIDSELPQAEIIKQIRERFVKTSNLSLQSITTTINETLNNAKLESIRAVNEHLIQFGMGALVVHISALLPTTRPHHAARHKKTFTVQQQFRWWNTGSNRNNCHCTVRSKVVKKS